MSIPDQKALSFRFTNSLFVKRTLLDSYLKPHAEAPRFAPETKTAVLIVSLPEPGPEKLCVHAHFIYRRHKDATHWTAVQLTRTQGPEFTPIASSDFYSMDNQEQTREALELYADFRKTMERCAHQDISSMLRKVAWTVIETPVENVDWMDLLSPYQ